MVKHYSLSDRAKEAIENARKDTILRAWGPVETVHLGRVLSIKPGGKQKHDEVEWQDADLTSGRPGKHVERRPAPTVMLNELERLDAVKGKLLLAICYTGKVEGKGKGGKGYHGFVVAPVK